MLESDHSHIFLAPDHERSERKTWAVIGLCGLMMAAEIGGGFLFGSIALIADGLHMSTHSGALLLAALAYRYARRHAQDPRFTFGTGKLGDLAGFTSAIVLAMIAMIIGYEAVARILHPASIHFAEAIPIACLGLAVNIASAWLLSGSDHEHHHDPAHGRSDHGGEEAHAIPEPHEFTAHVRPGSDRPHEAHFEEPRQGHSGAHRDNNMRAAIIHVAADAAVSVLVILGLVLAQALGWLWMDPLAGLVGACVIAGWSYALIRDTSSILLDMNPDATLAARLRATVEGQGDRLTDFHLWRVGPGHLAAIIGVATQQHDLDHYRRELSRFKILSHVTLEINCKGRQRSQALPT